MVVANSIDAEVVLDEPLDPESVELAPELVTTAIDALNELEACAEFATLAFPLFPEDGALLP